MRHPPHVPPPRPAPRPMLPPEAPAAPLEVVACTDTLDATQDRTLATIIATANDLEFGGTLASVPVWTRDAAGRIIGLQARTIATPKGVLIAECVDRMRVLMGQDFEPEVC